jgi:hypothetical protein
LFIDQEEVIYHSHPTLRHRVRIEVIEVVNWHQPPDSSDDDDLFGPWPKKTSFLESGPDTREEPHSMAGFRKWCQW